MVEIMQEEEDHAMEMAGICVLIIMILVGGLFLWVVLQ